MQIFLSKSKEFINEFREESDYETIIKYIEKENTNDVRVRLRRL